MQEIIKYLEDKYTLTANDLKLSDDKRGFLLGQLAMIEEIKEIYNKGIPK